MLNAEQIENWEADINTAREYARRRRKGIPSDRWTDGAVGAAKVAAGIDALDWMLAYSVAEIERLEAEIRKRGIDAMEAWRDPRRAE